MTAPVQTRTDQLAGSQVPTSVQAPTAAQAVPPSPGFLNIKQSYLDALEALGYTESEARFLYVVATHSGYFVARQFLAFTCGHWGKRTTAFWHKLHTKKHARTEYFPMNGKVYHAFSRRLYRQIGRENLRNRREHEFEYIQRRIGMLDFVLSHPEYKYLETELEKVSYFCDQLKVPTHFLPAKTYYGQKTSQPTVRYFVDKFPMFFDSDTSSPSPAVTFTYIQGPEASLTEFVHHLQAYLPLFRQLSAFRFLYLARVDSHFEKAKELFNSTAAIPLGSDTSAELCRYFQVRKAWDLRQYRSVSDGDLIFRNQAKTRFVGERFEHLYRVELSPQACTHLRRFLKSWHPNACRLLFATRNGTPWDQNLLLKRKFRPLFRALGIHVPRSNGFHAFRHANATLMSSFGASQKLRQQRLGHADGSPVTETIYTHVISEDGKRIAAQLGNAVWGVLDPSWTLKEEPGVSLVTNSRFIN